MDVEEQNTGLTEIKTHAPVLCTVKSMLVTKTLDPVSVQVTEKSLLESFEEIPHGSLKTSTLHLLNGEDMRAKSVDMNVIKDIPIFNGEESDPENHFPTFYIYNMNE